MQHKMTCVQSARITRVISTNLQLHQSKILRHVHVRVSMKNAKGEGFSIKYLIFCCVRSREFCCWTLSAAQQTHLKLHNKPHIIILRDQLSRYKSRICGSLIYWKDGTKFALFSTAMESSLVLGSCVSMSSIDGAQSIVKSSSRVDWLSLLASVSCKRGCWQLFYPLRR